MKHGFTICAGKGFQMTFDNGCTVSVQFGPGNYCDRRLSRWDAPAKFAAEQENWESSTAEVAGWDGDGRWIVPGGDLATRMVWGQDDVCGRVRPDLVAEYIAYVASL